MSMPSMELVARFLDGPLAGILEQSTRHHYPSAFIGGTVGVLGTLTAIQVCVHACGCACCAFACIRGAVLCKGVCALREVLLFVCGNMRLMLPAHERGTAEAQPSIAGRLPALLYERG